MNPFSALISNLGKFGIFLFGSSSIFPVLFELPLVWKNYTQWKMYRLLQQPELIKWIYFQGKVCLAHIKKFQLTQHNDRTILMLHSSCLGRHPLNGIYDQSSLSVALFTGTKLNINYSDFDNIKWFCHVLGTW